MNFSLTKHLFIFGIILLVYILRFVTFPNHEKNILISNGSEGVRQRFSVRILTEPNTDEFGVSFVSKIDEICQLENSGFEGGCKIVDPTGRTSFSVFGKSLQSVLENIERSEVKIGDQIELSGLLKYTKDCSKDICESDEIGYSNYLKKQRIFSEIISPKIIKISAPNEFILGRYLVDFRKKLEQRIDQILPRPASDLGKGLVISGKGSMSEELLEDFKKVGLIHIVVLSGSNVSIVSGALFVVLSKLPKVIQSAFGIILMVLFAIMTGASPPVVRSVAMSSVPVLVSLFGKRLKNRIEIPKGRLSLFNDSNQSTWTLIYIGLLMSIHNPLLPLYDMSFQLSFMATLGLMTLTEPFSKVLGWLPEKFVFREIVSCSLATQVFVLPLLLTISDEVSTVFLIANILVLPILPLTMFLVCAGLWASYTAPYIAMLFTEVSYIFLSWIIWVATCFSSFSLSIFHLATLTEYDALVIYGFIIPISIVIKFLVTTNMCDEIKSVKHHEGIVP